LIAFDAVSCALLGGLFVVLRPPRLTALIGIGTVAMALSGRRDDIVTTRITTAVVMVVAAMSPEDAWRQRVLRLSDTMVGITVGVAYTWAGSFLSYMSYLRQQTEEIMTGRKTFFVAVHSTAASTRSPMETLKLSLDFEQWVAFAPRWIASLLSR
jgi:hypothetical protein